LPCRTNNLDNSVLRRILRRSTLQKLFLMRKSVLTNFRNVRSVLYIYVVRYKLRNS
jgi:hypothetical protein